MKKMLVCLCVLLLCGGLLTACDENPAESADEPADTTVTITAGQTDIAPAVLADMSVTAYAVEEGNSHYTAMDGVLFSKDMTRLIRYPAARPDEAYVIPDGVTTVDQGAFAYAASLQTVTVPDSVTAIKKEAFSNATRLQTVALPPTLTELGERAFVGDVHLTSLDLSATALTTLETHTFKMCTSLQMVVMPHTLTTLKSGAFFDCVALSELAFPEGLTVLEDNVFGNCAGLSRADLSVCIDLKDIGGYAFFGCTGLQSVVLPPALETVSESAFQNTGLVEVTLPETVRKVQYGAFAGCTALTSVEVLGMDTIFSNGPATSYGCPVFEGADNVILIAPAGAQVEAYAADNGLTIRTAN